MNYFYMLFSRPQDKLWITCDETGPFTFTPLVSLDPTVNAYKNDVRSQAQINTNKAWWCSKWQTSGSPNDSISVL